MNVITDFDVRTCCGCMACVDACPTGALTVSKDGYGFMVPQIDSSKCVNCDKCFHVCPYNTQISGTSDPKVYAAVNRDDAVVLSSSSGGIFSAIAEEILSEGGKVYGATMNEDFTVTHIRIDNANDIDKLRKSKYIQSNLTGIYRMIENDLKLGYKVLFAGTPCQVHALLSYTDSKYDNLFTIDIVCHGIPSQELFNDYLKCLEDKTGKIQKYTFRAKSKRGEGMTWYSSYTRETGKTDIFNWPEDSYNFLYMKGYIYRDSCYSCKFSTKERISDITLCDYWGWTNYHAEDFKSGEAVSGVIVSTEKGQDIFLRIKEKLIYIESKYSQLLKHNNSIFTHQNDSALSTRKEILDSWKDNGYAHIDSVFRKKYRKQIAKYKLLRKMPYGIKKIIRGTIK